MPRHLYILLLRLHPRTFRERFGDEMLAAFDEARGAGNFFADAVRSLLRQWLLRPRIAPRTAAAVEGIPVFQSIGDDTPRRPALMSGGFVTIAIFAIAGMTMARPGVWRDRLIGSHHASRSHLLGVTSAAQPTSELQTEVAVAREPADPPLPQYFLKMPVLLALDRNRDGLISEGEMRDAPSALRTLDSNGDGKLSAAECGLHSAGLAIEYMRFHPVLAVLDANHDGEISAEEIRLAPNTLRSLDRNNDGVLSLRELAPRGRIPDSVPIPHPIILNGRHPDYPAHLK